LMPRNPQSLLSQASHPITLTAESAAGICQPQ
jgi:hypothetical protein